MVTLLLLTVALVPGCKGKKGPHPGLQPKRVVLWAPVSRAIATGEGLQLEAYVDYGGSKGAVSADIRRQDVADMVWQVSPRTGAVDRTTQVFTATQPGEYTVIADYGPLSSRPPLKVRVKSKYSGRYMGSLRLESVQGVRWGLSTIDFTVNDLGVVQGRYGVNMDVSVAQGKAAASVRLRIEGTLKGNVVDGDLQGTATSSASGGATSGYAGASLSIPLSAAGADGTIRAVFQDGVIAAFEGTVDGAPFTAKYFVSD